MDKFTQHIHKQCGIMGLACPCCNPAFAIGKQRTRRFARRRLRQELDAEIDLDLDPTPEQEWEDYDNNEFYNMLEEMRNQDAEPFLCHPDEEDLHVPILELVPLT